MMKISDKSDVVYYVQELSETGEGLIDPTQPFSHWHQANDYARDVLGLEVDKYTIIEWEVE